MGKRIAVAVAGVGVVALVGAGAVLALRDRGDRRPEVIVVAAGGGQADAAATEEARTSMIAPVGPQEIVVAVDLPALDGPARAWRFAGASGVTVAEVRRLADALGLAGEVQAIPAGEGGGWRVGPNDGSAPALTVSASPLGDWWYSSAPLLRVAACPAPEPDPEGPASSGATGADDEVVCEQPAPPEGVPDEATARAEGERLLAALGVDVAAVEVEVTGDEWGRTVVATPRLGGVRAPLGHNVTYGAAGAVQWASGYLAQPAEAGEYPRIGTAAALERLRAGRTWWGGPAVLAAESAAVSDTGVEVGGGSGSGVPPSDVPADTVLPVEPMEPMVITITGAEEALAMVWDAEATVWLLPAYTFLAADGGRWEVPAVPDEFIELAPTPEPVPAEPPPQPEPAPAAVEQYIGLTEDAAVALAAEEGRPVRVVERDGASLDATDDYSPERVNLVVADGIVTAARPG